jgi:hypothetical protein
MFVYLTIEGQEQIALGEKPRPWQYTLTDAARSYETTDILLGEVVIALPSAETCIQPVLDKLKAKEQEIQAEAYAEILKIKERREALLCLTMEAPAND